MMANDIYRPGKGLSSLIFWVDATQVVCSNVTMEYVLSAGLGASTNRFTHQCARPERP